MSKFIPVKFIQHDDVHQAMGISTERQEQICSIMDRATDSVIENGGALSTKIIEACYNAVKPQNELEILFVGYLTGCYIQESQDV